MIFDIIIINVVILFISDKEYLNVVFLLYINLFWILTSFLSNYYKIYRFTKVYRIFTLLFVQFLLIVLAFFAYFGIFKEGYEVGNQFLVLTSILGSLAAFKLISFFALKKYRSRGNNFRKVVLIGFDETSKKVIDLFNEKSDYGYRFYGFFSDKNSSHDSYLGKLNDSFDYIIEHHIDEIYCAVSAMNKEQVKEFTKFANIHSRSIKLIPNSNELYSKNLNPEYYGNTLVLNVKRLPLEIAENRVIKRIFDVVFSMMIILFLMSWLAPILWILIKLESKGSALFKQEREGLGGYHFTCYKFRSMKLNTESDKIHATKNDQRITKIGAFMRKTSLDELPQFFNVLKGDMSVVGPRPHMKSLSVEYQKEIDNYMQRHVVRPGITGLAQVSGYRGEVKKTSDIKNRVRFDIFYIENWSILLDIKIIFNTIFNVLKGEEKAY